MRILAIGECMAELAPTGGPGAYRLGFAGDTYNTAWYLARLRSGATVSYFSAIGDDAVSGQMREAMIEAGIDESNLQVIAGRTVGLYLIALDKGERSFAYWRGQSAAKELARDPVAMATAMALSDLIYFSGITLAILDADGRRNLLNELRKAREAGKRIAFDPNLRPRLWTNPAEMTRVIMQGAALADIALPSYEDEECWFKDADAEATAERYAEAGAGTVVVKNGPDPVHWLERDRRGIVEVPPLADVVDTTAAGDSFNAAILTGLAQGRGIDTCIPAACKLAGEVVRGRGALVPFDPGIMDQVATV